MRLGYREMGLELFSLKENFSSQPKWPPMVEEKRDDGVGYQIKLFLKESLAQQRNEMMDNFAYILRRLPTMMVTPSTSSHFKGVAPFKV
jgi:hypothetical protein